MPAASAPATRAMWETRAAARSDRCSCRYRVTAFTFLHRGEHVGATLGDDTGFTKRRSVMFKLALSTVAVAAVVVASGCGFNKSAAEHVDDALAAVNANDTQHAPT